MAGAKKEELQKVMEDLESITERLLKLGEKDYANQVIDITTGMSVEIETWGEDYIRGIRVRN